MSPPPQQKNKKTVAFFINVYDSFTGGPRVVYNFVCKIDQSRFEPVVLTNKKSELTDNLEALGVRYLIVEQDLEIAKAEKKTVQSGVFAKIVAAWKTRLYNKKIQLLLAKEAVELLWVRNVKAVLLSGWAAKRLRLPLIWDIGMEKTSRGLVKHLHDIGFRLADKVVTESPCVAKSIFSNAQIKRNQKKLMVVKSGIPEDRIREIESAAKKFSKDANRFNIINIASISQRKNQQMIVRAVLPLIAENPQISVSFVGPTIESNYLAETTKMINEAGADKNFQFLGWCDNATEYLVSSDLFVLGSRVEGVPYSILEAMHAQVPVVATDCGGVPDVVIDEHTGDLVQVDDHADMSARIKKHLLDQERSKKLAANAYRFVNANHTAERWCNSYMDLFDSLIETHSRGSV